MHIVHSNAQRTIVAEPAILYFGTPVVLIGTCNEDGSYNLAPMSSAWWLGWRCMVSAPSRKARRTCCAPASAC
jgi:flavin reductase (DIM6/NTAB) family NADH-FMN oxidoreductase RutF